MRAGTSEVHTLGLGSCPAHPASQMRPAQEPCGQAARRSPSATPSLETGTAPLALRSVCWTSKTVCGVLVLGEEQKTKSPGSIMPNQREMVLPSG